MKDKIKYNPIDKSLIKGYNKIRSRNKRNRICHAPYKTLFFSQYGEIFACFYNKKEKLGHYPENSLNDIWFGDKLRTLREYIDKDDLSYGCEDCKRYLEKKNYYSVGAWKYDYLPNAKADYPISIDFQISNKCNLQCIMCSGENSELVRKNVEQELPYENPYDDNFVGQLTPYLENLHEISFTGGEPFIIDIYYKIWDEIITVNPKIKVSITTNGTILNDKVKEYLNKLKFNITVSIDSINKENFEQIRLNSNLDKILENLNFFQEYTKKAGTTLNVKICPMRQNWKDIPELLEYLNRLNIPAIFNNVLYPPYCTLWNLNNDELNKIRTYLLGFKFISKTSIQKDNIDRFNNLIKQIQNWEKEALDRTTCPNNIDELRKVFNDKIVEYFEADTTIGGNEKITKLERFLGISAEMFSDIEEETLKKALKYFIGLPIDRVIGEMEFRTIEKLKERVNQAGK